MPKVSPIQQNFNAGEWSPLTEGRTDLDKYKNALRTCLNSIPLVQGGVTRRPGTKFVAEQRSHSAAGRLIPFQFSVTQAYVILLEDQKFRFFKDNALITLTAQNITAITKANPAVVTYAGADTYANGDRVTISGVVGMTQVNNREFEVANVNAGANTFELLAVDSTTYDTYTSGGTVAEIYEVVNPYVTADLFELKFAQSADVLYITHPDYAPRKLSRTGHTSWTLTTITFLDGPYLTTNVTATTLTPGAATGATTLTASATTGINNDAGFAATDVGRFVRMREGSTWGYAVITGWTSTTVVDITVLSTLTNTNAKATWRMGVWSTTTGYPAAVTFFEDRLFFGGATSYPQRIDGSKSSDYENFAPTALDGTVADDNAVSFTLNASDVNVIRWLSDEERGLVVGTVGGEWIVRPSNQSEALSPTNITAKRSTSYGSANVQPVQAGKSILFLNRSKRKLRELAYVYEVDGFRAPDMTVLAEHVTKTGLTQLAYQQNPQSLVWGTRVDGILPAMTYEREQSVLGWHRHQIGGYGNSGQTTNAVVESVAVIPSPDGTRDEVWLTVQRYIDGGAKRYIEYITKIWEDGDDQVDAFFVDCGLTYDSTPATTITGLWHLEGQSVQILTDGATHPNKTVMNGKITLDRSASVVQIGFQSVARGQMLRIDAGAADGTAQGKKQRIHRVIFRVWQSLGLKVGADFTTMHRPPMRSSADDAGAAVPLVTDDIEVDWEGDYSTAERVCWEWDQPLPGTILAVMPQLHTQDR